MLTQEQREQIDEAVAAFVRRYALLMLPADAKGEQGREVLVAMTAVAAQVERAARAEAASAAQAALRRGARQKDVAGAASIKRQTAARKWARSA